MVSAAESATRLADHKAFIDSAAAGMRHVVYTSFVAAAPDAVFTPARDHFATEEHLRASGMAWTFLRDNFYLDFMPMMVGDDGVIRRPAGTGRAALVSRRDEAAVAAGILADPGAHAEQTHELTGPEALTMAETAGILSSGLGRNISFRNETIADAYESRTAWDAPQWPYDAWVSSYPSIAPGAMAYLSPSVGDITERAPRTLAEFLAAGVGSSGPNQPSAEAGRNANGGEVFSTRQRQLTGQCQSASAGTLSQQWSTFPGRSRSCGGKHETLPHQVRERSRESSHCCESVGEKDAIAAIASVRVGGATAC